MTYFAHSYMIVGETISTLETLLLGTVKMQVDNLTIEISEFENDAMVEDRSGEVSKILRAIADRIDSGGGLINATDGLRLKDSNGNQVGECVVDWSEDDEDCGPIDDCESIEGVYGASHNNCEVFVHLASGWYCVQGSRNVNNCYDVDQLIDGVDVEELQDSDCFTNDTDIDTLEEFAQAIADEV